MKALGSNNPNTLGFTKQHEHGSSTVTVEGGKHEHVSSCVTVKGGKHASIVI